MLPASCGRDRSGSRQKKFEIGISPDRLKLPERFSFRRRAPFIHFDIRCSKFVIRYSLSGRSEEPDRLKQT
jgi:hypothetical protein